jgi:hypothetical protein
MRVLGVGFLRLGGRLEPKKSLEEFLATESATRAENGGENDGWQRYHFRRQSLGDGRMLGVSLYFFHGSLSKVSFGYLPKGEGDWSAWSKEQELARADTYRQELSRQLGRLGRFPWGFVVRSTTTKVRVLASSCAPSLLVVDGDK